jgi:hypothetical protein
LWVDPSNVDVLDERLPVEADDTIDMAETGRLGVENVVVDFGVALDGVVGGLDGVEVTMLEDTLELDEVDEEMDMADPGLLVGVKNGAAVLDFEGVVGSIVVAVVVVVGVGKSNRVGKS